MCSHAAHMRSDAALRSFCVLPDCPVAASPMGTLALASCTPNSSPSTSASSLRSFSVERSDLLSSGECACRRSVGGTHTHIRATRTRRDRTPCPPAGTTRNSRTQQHATATTNRAHYHCLPEPTADHLSFVSSRFGLFAGPRVQRICTCLFLYLGLLAPRLQRSASRPVAHMHPASYLAYPL